MSRRVTFSRNLTLSLSRTCRAYCKYCSFATHGPHLHEPDEVLRLIDRAARGGKVKELLVLTGEAPDHHPEVRAKLTELGFDGFTAYAAWVCEQALERGLLPHTNLGVLGAEDMARLREVTASQGLMIESVVEGLVAHQGSPSKEPGPRLEMLREAGRLRIPFTTGILVGIGETHEDRFAALEAIAAIHREHGHVQEVIVQNFVPHERYYGREPAEIATEAASRFWHTGVGSGPDLPRPAWASDVTVEELAELVAHARGLMPEIGISVPPNLSEHWPELVAAGATDLGGLSSNGDHISPEHPFPSPAQVRRRMASDGVAVAERLCVYGRFMTADWIDPHVMGVIGERYPTFIPRHAAGSQGVRSVDATLVPSAIERAREGHVLRPEELTALFAETRPEAVEEIRLAADELRARLTGDEVTFVVNRNINVSNVCIVGCAFCGFGKGRRSPEAYEHPRAEFIARVQEAVAADATELCIQSGIHPDWNLETYAGWLRLAKEVAPQLHLHAYSPMEIDHICTVEGRSPQDVLSVLRDAGLGSTPGTAAEVLHDGVRKRISPNKLPVERWVRVIEASHAVGLRSTATVMFGHVERPHELAEHMRIVRGIAERTGGITEFVPLSFVPYGTLLGRTQGIEEISREDNLRHSAVFRLALGPAVTNVQASWVKMGLDAATEALRWGVNDLGGTLMEESITRMAGGRHGTRLEVGDLVGAAWRAGRPAAERGTLYDVRRRYPLPGPEPAGDPAAPVGGSLRAA